MHSEYELGRGMHLGVPASGGRCYEWMCKRCQGIKYGDSPTVEPMCRCEKEEIRL